MRERGTPGERVQPDFSTVPGYVWVLALAVLLLASVACGLWAVYTLRSQRPLPGPSPTPVIWTATPAPTQPPAPNPTETPVPTPTVSPEIAIGRYVQVTGTEGVGISLREQPDVNSARLGIGYDGEVFGILDGPRQVGGYTWWLVHDPNDTERRGWAVGNYLEPVDHP
jgi:hypothetical protein